MSKIEKLYRSQILEEAKNPFHFEKFSEGVERVRAYNPICGDRFDLYLKDRELYFHGFGCAISKASTSFMIREIDGKSVQEGLEVIKEFLKNLEEREVIHSDRLKVFQDFENFKGRKECIILSWKVMKNFLENKS